MLSKLEFTVIFPKKDASDSDRKGKSNLNIPLLMSEVSFCKYRLQVDLEHQTIIASNVDTLGIDKIIKLVESHFEIEAIVLDSVETDSENNSSIDYVWANVTVSSEMHTE